MEETTTRDPPDEPFRSERCPRWALGSAGSLGRCDDLHRHLHERAGVFDAIRIALPAATERRLVPRPSRRPSGAPSAGRRGGQGGERERDRLLLEARLGEPPLEPRIPAQEALGGDPAASSSPRGPSGRRRRSRMGCGPGRAAPPATRRPQPGAFAVEARFSDAAATCHGRAALRPEAAAASSRPPDLSRPAREHFVHFAARRRATWTLGPYSEHFVHFADQAIAKWTKCTLTAADLPTLPTQPQLTFNRARATGSPRAPTGASPAPRRPASA